MLDCLSTIKLEAGKIYQMISHFWAKSIFTR